MWVARAQMVLGCTQRVGHGPGNKAVNSDPSLFLFQASAFASLVDRLSIN